MDSKLTIKTAEELPQRVTDLATNISPLGVPKGAIQSAEAALQLCARYPDGNCTVLSEKIARQWGVQPEQVLCGNGADDIIYRIIFSQKPKKACLLAPTFEDYERALRQSGCEIQFHQLREKQEFMLTDALLNELDGFVDLLILCNPNNPTGQLIKPELMERILKHCRVNGILVMVDECFVGFLEDMDDYSMRKKTTEYENLIVVDAFTKLYGLAGFRLGYCICGNQELLAQVKEYGPEWGVSIPAQAAGIGALSETDYLYRTRTMVKEENRRMKNRLAALEIRVIGSEVNYLFFRSPLPGLRGKLLDRKVLIRDCSKFRGLDGEFCRVAVKTPAENDRFLTMLEELLHLERKDKHMELRKTTEADIGDIMNIIGQAQEYLRTQDIDQWQDGYPNEDTIKADIRAEISYVVVERGMVVGTAAVSFDGEKTYDQIYEGRWLSTGAFAVIHRLAVDNQSKGSGVSVFILEQVESWCRQKGISSIKVDTHEQNLSMRRFLEKNGFAYCGIILLDRGDCRRVAYEKALL